jgi:hypothetical protein
MSTLTDRMYAQARIIPVSAPNRVKTITKLENGNLRIEQQSGNVFDVSKDDPEFQVFVVYMVLNEDA